MGPEAGTGCAPLPSSCPAPTTAGAPRSRRQRPSPGSAPGRGGHPCPEPREPRDRAARRPPTSRHSLVSPLLTADCPRQAYSAMAATAEMVIYYLRLPRGSFPTPPPPPPWKRASKQPSQAGGRCFPLGCRFWWPGWGDCILVLCQGGMLTHRYAAISAISDL